MVYVKSVIVLHRMCSIVYIVMSNICTADYCIMGMSNCVNAHSCLSIVLSTIPQADTVVDQLLLNLG